MTFWDTTLSEAQPGLSEECFRSVGQIRSKWISLDMSVFDLVCVVCVPAVAM